MKKQLFNKQEQRAMENGLNTFIDELSEILESPTIKKFRKQEEKRLELLIRKALRKELNALK